ncbi:hypothetical protein ACUXZZ_00880 [Streptomyces graminifolii]|uniref:hypothetical protein n=1 Tax=Streptomyces graminifolii TaxID=1266771 RepID=UPI004057FE10
MAELRAMFQAFGSLTERGGAALVNGKFCAQRHAPIQELGVLLEDRAVHPGRSVFNHKGVCTGSQHPGGALSP